MLDVIFLLLCFFVTVSVFSQWENEISIKLPSAETSDEPDRLPVGPELKYKWDCWMKGGCLSSEMESAALYIVCATLQDARAGCILNVCWNQECKKLGLPDPEQHDTALACQAAVEAVRLLIEQDREAAERK